MTKKLLLHFLLLFSFIYCFGQTVANQPPNLTKCSYMNSLATFDLTEQTPIILGNQDAEVFNVKYFSSMQNAQANVNAIENPTYVSAYVIPSFSTFYARVTNTVDSTYGITSFTAQTITIILYEETIIYCGYKPLSPLNIGNYYTGPNATGEMIDTETQEYIVYENGAQFYIHAEAGDCIFDIPIIVTFNEGPEINEPTPLIVCDENNDGIFDVDVTTKNVEITNGAEQLYITYYTTPMDAINAVNQIPNPTTFISAVVPPYEVFIRVESLITSCASYTSLLVDAGDCTDNTFSGAVTYDINNNGCGEGAIPASNRVVSYTHNNVVYNTFTNEEGHYSFANVPNGNSTVTAGYGLFNATPSSGQVTMPGPVENVDFCLSIDNPVTDVSVMFYPITTARPGQIAKYCLSYRNLNADIVSGTVTLQFDDEKLDFLSSGIPMNVSGNTLTFSYENLMPFSLHSIVIKFTVMIPPVVNMADVLDFTATITASGNEVNLENNTSLWSQIVVNSMDPNDITVREGEFITEEQADDYLNYVIRFQNKGTAEALDVRVAALLDSNLDWSTFEPVASSHDYQANRKNNQIEFLYKGINLAFENQNTGEVPESNGYIIYRIKPKTSVTIGDSMSAQADIYFDFNDPITTNEVTTTVQNVTGINDNNISLFKVYPNPASGYVNLVLSNVESDSFDVTVIDMLGKTVLKSSFTSNEANLNTTSLSSGIYFVSVTAGDKSEIKKLIIR